MEPIYLFKILLVFNLLALGGLCLYAPLKARMEISVISLLLSFVPLIIFQLGSLFFIRSPFSGQGVTLLLTGVALLPLTLTPLSQTLARKPQPKIPKGWLIYYACQLLIFAIFFRQIITGRVIEWVTGILDQPIILRRIPALR